MAKHDKNYQRNINLGKKQRVSNVVQMLFLLNVKSPIHDPSPQSDENMVYICTFVFSWFVFNYPHTQKNSQNVSCSSLLTAKTGTSEAFTELVTIPLKVLLT